MNSNCFAIFFSGILVMSVQISILVNAKLYEIEMMMLFLVSYILSSISELKPRKLNMNLFYMGILDRAGNNSKLQRIKIVKKLTID